LLKAQKHESLGKSRLDEMIPGPGPTAAAVGAAQAFLATMVALLVATGRVRNPDRPWLPHVCYSITGVIEASGCSDPTAGDDSSVLLVGHTYHPYPDRPVVHGVVGKSVAGITLTLDDGRVLTTETLKSKALPVAFFVVPLKKDSQVAVYEALNPDGKVLDESSYRP
jgi:hypothetical protein